MADPTGRQGSTAREAAAAAWDARAQQLAEEAVERALRSVARRYRKRTDAAAAEWRRVALVAVHRCAQALDEFDADDVWVALGAQPGRSGEMVGAIESVRGRSALGPVLRQARRLGWIEPTGRVGGYDTDSTQRHRALLVWRSLLRGGGAGAGPEA